MTANRTQLSVFAILTVAACAGASSADLASPSTPDRAGVQAAIDAHDTAWNAHDPSALAGLFAPQGTLVTPTGNRLEGHDALQASFAQPGPTTQTQSASQIDGVQWLADDLVLVDARQTLSGPGVEMLGVSEANLVAVLRRVDGDWKFVAARPYIPARG